MSEFLPERKWFRWVVFSDSMLMGMIDFLFMLIFSMLPEGNENAQSPRLPSGLLRFRHSCHWFLSPLCGFFSGFLLLN
jgi:hypothetical protein